MSTAQNLKDAFAGESQANRRYTAFAKKADREGYPNVALLFRAAAEAETIHALGHFRVMGGTKSTAENLQVAIEGEAYEFQQMYPAFVAEAEQEKNPAAVMTFKGAMAVEKIHHDLYSKALEAVKSGQDLPAASSIWICDVCGNTVVGEPPDKCPICNAPKNRFFAVK